MLVTTQFIYSHYKLISMIKVKMKIIVSDEENVLNEIERVVEINSEEVKFRKSKVDEILWFLNGREVDEIYDYIMK